MATQPQQEPTWTLVTSMAVVVIVVVASIIITPWIAVPTAVALLIAASVTSD